MNVVLNCNVKSIENNEKLSKMTLEFYDERTQRAYKQLVLIISFNNIINKPVINVLTIQLFHIIIGFKPVYGILKRVSKYWNIFSTLGGYISHYLD